MIFMAQAPTLLYGLRGVLSFLLASVLIYKNKKDESDGLIPLVIFILSKHRIYNVATSPQPTDLPHWNILGNVLNLYVSIKKNHISSSLIIQLIPGNPWVDLLPKYSASITTTIKYCHCFTLSLPWSLGLYFISVIQTINQLIHSLWNWEGLPWWLSGKEATRQGKIHGFQSWVGKMPWRRKWQPTPVFLPRKFCGQRSLVATVYGTAKSQARLTTKQQRQQWNWEYNYLVKWSRTPGPVLTLPYVCEKTLAKE